jgi:hypothetical protein
VLAIETLNEVLAVGAAEHRPGSPGFLTPDS